MIQTSRQNVSENVYQLQPENTMVQENRLLPAAALSNFFKPAAMPIHEGKLPRIRPKLSSTYPKPSKSINQRNYCLAEIIQSQLIELKRLQGRYRYRDARLRNEQTSSSLESSPLHQPRPPIGPRTDDNSSPSSNDDAANIPKELKRNDSVLTSVSQQTPRTTRLLKRPQMGKQTSLGSLAEKTNSDSLPVVTSRLSLETPGLPNPIPEALPLTKPTKLEPLNTQALLSTNMDPIKFASIYRWVASVEKAQRAEGKFSEVIPIPTSDKSEQENS